MSLLENRIDIFWFANSINPIEIQSADWEKLLVFVWVFWPYFSLPVQPVEGEQDCYYYSHSWHFLETDLHLVRRNCGELRQRSGFLAVVVRLFVVSDAICGKLPPITAKLSMPLAPTQQPAVHIECGITIPGLFPPNRWIAGPRPNPTGFAWWSWTNEGPVKRYNTPFLCAWLVQVFRAFLRILISYRDHEPWLKGPSCGTAFVYL